MQEIRVKRIDVNENNVQIKKVYYQEGDEISVDDIILTVETTKSTEDITAEEKGYLKLFCSEGDNLALDELIGVIYAEENELEALNQQKKTNRDIRATKKAVELAEKEKIDLENIKTEGIIKEKDVRKYLEKKSKKRNFNIYTGPFQYDRERVLIIASGMGAGVVYDILLMDNNKEIVGLIGEKRKDKKIPDLPVLDTDFENFYKKIDKNLYDTVILSTASNLNFREKLFNLYYEYGIKFTNAIHPSTIISRECKIGYGNVIGGGCFLGYATIIGGNNWIANHVNIDHHNALGSTCLIGPGSKTSGDVIIGNKVTIGAGVYMENYVRIDDEAKIGSGIILPYNTKIEKSKIIKTQI